MKNRRGLNNILITDRKILYIILGIVMISVVTLTVVYAALSTTLNINGNAEVTAASWDIYLDNVQLNSNSVTTNVPTITDKTTASFSTTLTKPGDFYEFTIDVVNNGSIDAMIDSVTKTPELSDTQKKYLNYIVEYQNGESITTKQLVEKKSFVRLKVKVGLRTDLTSSDLPSTSEALNLSFKVNYIQSDENSTAVTDNGILKKTLNIITGDLETVGSEFALGEEHFYLLSSDSEKITALAKYNLYVGGERVTENDEQIWVPYNEATGIQNAASEQARIPFSTTNYWATSVVNYPAYVYDSNSYIYEHTENYKVYLENMGFNIEEVRLIKKEELSELGCSGMNCTKTPEWVRSLSYWTGTANNSTTIHGIDDDGLLEYANYNSTSWYGVRPVVVIKK